jgi:hypothetical protein
MALVAGSQANARYMKDHNTVSAEDAYKGIGSKEATGHIKPDGSHINDP